MIHTVHLIDSPFYGGPERQILGLTTGLQGEIRSSVLCFQNGASWQDFPERLMHAGIAARGLETQRRGLPRIAAEVRRTLQEIEADLLICHGYKADILGWVAARLAGIPVVAVSRGGTSHTRKVRLNQAIDGRFLSWMDAVVCVSEGQAREVRSAGVSEERIQVIRNAIDPTRFPAPDRSEPNSLGRFFPALVDHVVVAVGRLSPEKGFSDLVSAAERVLRVRPRTGFLIIGDGVLRDSLAARIRDAGLTENVVLAGFRRDVDALLPHADLLVQSSLTEGLPNVLLEAGLAGIPVVATRVGGTPEVVRDGETGLLVPPGEAAALAGGILTLLDTPVRRREMGIYARAEIAARFTFRVQCNRYRALFRSLLEDSDDLLLAESALPHVDLLPRPGPQGLPAR